MDAEKKELLGQVLGAFAGEAVRIEDLNPEDDLAKRGVQFSNFFTNAVAAFTQWPDPHISKLAKNIWDVFHNRYVNLCLGPKVPTLSCAIVPPQLLKAMGFPTGPDHQCVVLAPENWLDMIKEDPIYQMGAVLFVGSQSVDFYNKRHFIDPRNIGTRSQMYEALFLKHMPPSRLNDYQKRIVADHGELDSTLLYEMKPVEVVS